MNNMNTIITIDTSTERNGMDAEQYWLYSFIKEATVNQKFETLETLEQNTELKLKARQIRYLINDLLRLGKISASHHVLTKAGFTSTRDNADRVNGSQSSPNQIDSNKGGSNE